MGGVLRDKAPALSEIPRETRIDTCMHALIERLTILFSYKNERRKVNPVRLVFSGGNWYLIAYDNDRQDIRHFRLERIEGEIELTIEKFEPHAEVSEITQEPPWRFGEEEKLVELKIHKSHAAWALETIGESAVYEELSDGSIILREVVRDWKIFRSFIFSFLGAAEVIEPAESRKAIIDWLESMQ